METVKKDLVFRRVTNFKSLSEGQNGIICSKKTLFSLPGNY